MSYLTPESEWVPSSNTAISKSLFGLKFENYAALMQGVNIVLLPLILVGLTGFLKRKD